MTQNQVKYKVTIKTGNSLGAGTDADITLEIFGDKTNTKLGLNSSVSIDKEGDIFEKGKIDVFELHSVDVGTIQHIKIGHDGSKIGAAWELESITIDSPKGSESWTVNKWLDKDKKTNFLELKSKNTKHDTSVKSDKVKYKVTVKTGDSVSAGTDAEIMLEIFGDKTNTAKLALNSNVSLDKTGDIFEKGKIDVFELHAIDIGTLKHIKIGHDGSKTGSTWQLESITIDYPKGSETWMVNKWLDKSDNSNFIQLKSNSKPTLKSEKPEPKHEPKKEEKPKLKTESKAEKPKSVKRIERPEKQGDKITHPEVTDEFTQIELSRIKAGLSKEVAQIKYPKRQDFKPFVFNNLSPYYDIKETEMLVNAPEKMNSVGYYNRYTALSIVEPWVSHRMEHNLAPIMSRSLNHNAGGRSHLEDLSTFERPKREELEGSTLAPNFPKIIIKKPKDMNGPFYFDDVPVIRKELKNNLTNHTRFEEDRNRTINDYYRMNLDTTAEKEKMKDAYHAYLENTPGSKKALHELLTKKHLIGLDGKVEPKDDSKESQEPVEQLKLHKIPAKKDKVEKIKYKITVTTGESLGAGTDAEIVLEIIGVKGTTKSLALNNAANISGNKDIFERGATDVFEIEADNVGKIKSIKLGHDGSKSNAEWKCESIKIESEVGTETWKIDKFFEKSKGTNMQELKVQTA